MLKIEKEIFDNLGFDFEEALKVYASEKEQHRSTVYVPAPTANPYVDAAYEAGGYEVVDSSPQTREPEMVLPEPPEPKPDPRKDEVAAKLQKLKGQKAEFQLDGIRELLTLIFQILLG